jgi:hypothetical protein
LNPGKGFNKHLPLDRSRWILTFACLLATCFALFLVKPWHSIVRFDSEVIRVTVDPERITVNGLYRLYNPLPFPVTQWFFYPTPLGGGLEPVDKLQVERLPGRPKAVPELLSPVKKGSREYYRVKVPGRGILEVRAMYSQRHNGAYGRYVLTTTESWGRPLRRAQFELELDSVDLIDSNYELSGSKNGALTFQRSGFMPDEDWVFTFKRVGDIL